MLPCLELSRNYLSCGWVGGWVAGENGNNANSASTEVGVEVEVEAELGNKPNSVELS